MLFGRLKPQEVVSLSVCFGPVLCLQALFLILQKRGDGERRRSRLPRMVAIGEGSSVEGSLPPTANLPDESQAAEWLS